MDRFPYIAVLSLHVHEATQIDFAGGLQDMDVGFGFGIDAAFGSEAVAWDAGLPPVAVPNIAGDGSDLYYGCNVGGGEEEEWRRRLRRKISNRESARRSRARRRQRVEEFERAVDALRAEKRALAARLDATARSALAVLGDNARLHAKAGALRRRLGEAHRNAAVLIGLSRLMRTASHGGADSAMGGSAPPPQPAGGVASLMT
ncbi:hypothetical protein GUJ93_ZPchr0007g3054 [Zizania palustris]|uniref:BZIP domain-containing protein n=1 Tax=Zizania palustris TaxID=103762 RepID=A0A8J5SVH3_ZIZPA|nr:hypothetical protein GUJ93_ZPchr0007g3054 [Zizania palustris]